MSTMIRDVPKPDCCALCKSLRWGRDEGWDKCEKHGYSIRWEAKRSKICDDFERSPLEDPRSFWQKPKPPKDTSAFLEDLQNRACRTGRFPVGMGLTDFTDYIRSLYPELCNDIGMETRIDHPSAPVQVNAPLSLKTRDEIKELLDRKDALPTLPPKGQSGEWPEHKEQVKAIREHVAQEHMSAEPVGGKPEVPTRSLRQRVWARLKGRVPERMMTGSTGVILWEALDAALDIEEFRMTTNPERIADMTNEGREPDEHKP